MTVVLTYDAGGAKLPKTSVVITAHRDKISRVGAKGAVPDPALMVVKNCITWKGPSSRDQIGQSAER